MVPFINSTSVKQTRYHRETTNLQFPCNTLKPDVRANMLSYPGNKTITVIDSEMQIMSACESQLKRSEFDRPETLSTKQTRQQTSKWKTSKKVPWCEQRYRPRTLIDQPVLPETLISNMPEEGEVPYFVRHNANVVFQMFPESKMANTLMRARAIMQSNQPPICPKEMVDILSDSQRQKSLPPEKLTIWG